MPNMGTRLLLSYTFPTPIPLEIQHILTSMYLQVNQEHTWPIISTIFVKTEGLFNVAGNHIHCKTYNISEMPQERDVVGTDHQQQVITYWIVAIPITFSDFQGHAPVAGLLKCDFFSYNYAAGDKISADMACHTVSLQ